MIYRVVTLLEAQLASDGIYEDATFTDSPGYKHVWLRREDAFSWLNSRFYPVSERSSLAIIEIPVDPAKAVPSHMDTFNCGMVFKVALKDLTGLRATRVSG